MKKLINKINNFIDKHINNNLAIIIFSCTVITICRLSVITSFLLYALGCHIISRKFEVLEDQVKILEFEKSQMLLALSDEDLELKAYLHNKEIEDIQNKERSDK